MLVAKIFDDIGCIKCKHIGFWQNKKVFICNGGIYIHVDLEQDLPSFAELPQEIKTKAIFQALKA